MCSEQPCIEPSQIFQPSEARAALSWLGPPIRLLRSCPVFDALGVGREALRLGVGWLWCGGLHGSRCRRCRACCGFGPWQSGDAPVDYVDDSHVHVAAAGRVVDRDDAVQTIRERLPSFVVVRAAVRFFHYRSGLHEPFGAGVALLFGLFGPDPALVLPDALDLAQAENPTQDTKRPAPSGDEPLDLSEPEDWGEASPFESRQAPRTKADLLNEIRQRTDRLTGQREAEQRQIDPWSAQPPQRRGHGR